MNYYFQIISLNGCPYSRNAEILLKNTDHKLTNINYSEKDKWINKNIKTFPQIYLKKESSNGNLLIGGFDDINSINNIIHKKDKNFIDKIENISKLYPNIGRKTILRIIELLQNKIN